MKKLAILIPLLIAIVGCAAQTPTPDTRPIADASFSGYAFLDSNFNGQLDAEDAPLEGATFYVAIDGVKTFSETTDKNGYASIPIPSNVDYPITLSMEAPKDSAIEHAGFSEVVIYSSADETPKFLFTSK